MEGIGVVFMTEIDKNVPVVVGDIELARNEFKGRKVVQRVKITCIGDDGIRNRVSRIKENLMRRPDLPDVVLQRKDSD